MVSLCYLAPKEGHSSKTSLAGRQSTPFVASISILHTEDSRMIDEYVYSHIPDGRVLSCEVEGHIPTRHTSHVTVERLFETMPPSSRQKNTM